MSISGPPLPEWALTAPSSCRRSLTFSDSQGSSMATVVRKAVGVGLVGSVASIATTPSCERFTVLNEVS